MVRGWIPPNRPRVQNLETEAKHRRGARSKACREFGKRGGRTKARRCGNRPPMAALPPPMFPRVTPTDPEGRNINFPGGPLHVVEEGPQDGPVALMLHGIPGNVRDFRYLGPALAAKGIRAIRIDMPGLGKTPWKTFPHPESKNRAAFLVKLLDVLEAPRAAIIGHSFGGTVALTTAGLFPERLWALGLVNSPGLHRHRGLGFVPPNLLRLASRGFSVPGVGEILAMGMREAYRALQFKDVEQISDESLGHHAALVGNLDFKVHRYAARKVTAPVFMYSSKKDPLIEAEIPHHLAQAIGAAGKTQVHHLQTTTGGHYLQRNAAARIATDLARVAPR